MDPALVTKAYEKIREGQVIFLAVSGKIGAGKDTVAPEVMRLLGYSPADHESFARVLKDEVDMVIKLIRGVHDQTEAVLLVERTLSASNVEEAVSALWAEVKSGAVQSSHERTTGTRRALQWWGTEVRRSVDADYWVKKTIRASLEKLAAGISVYVTDARFPNEADSSTHIKGILIRLEVSKAEQERRIIERDGIVSNPGALDHASEIALDDYPFPHVLDTNVLNLEDTVAAACEIVRKRPPVEL